MTPFHTIGHDIKVALDNGAFMGAIILTYAAIDAMAFLSMPENKKEVHRGDFVNWVEKYMETDSKQPYQYRGIDLYGARCGIVHRYGATSRLSDSKRCKIFGYHNGSEHMYNPSVNVRVVLISGKRLINDFFKAMQRFLTDIMRDEELKKRIERRIVNLLHVSQV
jgi:hypothetical protein